MKPSTTNVWLLCFPRFIGSLITKHSEIKWSLWQIRRRSGKIRLISFIAIVLHVSKWLNNSCCSVKGENDIGIFQYNKRRKSWVHPIQWVTTSWLCFQFTNLKANTNPCLIAVHWRNGSCSVNRRNIIRRTNCWKSRWNSYWKAKWTFHSLRSSLQWQTLQKELKFILDLKRDYVP